MVSKQNYRSKYFTLVCLVFVSACVSIFLLQNLSAYNSVSYPIPFKYPSYNINSQIISEHDMHAVVLGAGPAGLLSAIALYKTGCYTTIFLIEKRTHYTRTNAFNLRPQCFPMLERLGLKNTFEDIAHFVPSLRFHSKSFQGIEIEEELFTGTPDEIDYTQILPSIFPGFGWPHHAITINDLEHTLSEDLKKYPGIYLLHGHAEIFSDESSDMNSVHFVSANKELFPNFIIDKPSLIVVAEGSRSETRDKLVGFTDSRKEQREYWYTGAVSLDGIIDPRTNNHFTVLEDQPENRFTLAVLLPERGEMLINGSIVGHDVCCTPEVYLQRGALEVLEREQSFLSLHMPHSFQDLVVHRCGIVAVELRKAKSFVFGDNLIFIGDCAGSGSPVGGFGLSFLCSVYMDALLRLSNEIVSGGNKIEAMQSYNDRVNEIIHHWCPRDSE